MALGGNGVSEIMNMGERSYLQKNERDALTTHNINGGVKRNSYGAIMSVEQRLINEVAGGFKRKPLFLQEGVVPQMYGQGRNASQIVFGDNMAAVPIGHKEN